MGMKRPKRPTESRPGKVFKTGSSPTDSIVIDLSYSYRAFGGVGSTSQSCRVQDGGKSRHAERSENNVFSAGSSLRSLAGLSGRGGRCLACKRVIRTTNPKPQQPLISMIFTNADPRYAGRFDDDTIVTVERVREVIDFNAGLVDE